MKSNGGEMEELSALIKEVGDGLTDEACLKFSDLLEERFLTELIPLETWIGIAQALADASGYRLVFQAGRFEDVPEDVSQKRLIGYRDVGSAEPSLFLKEG